MPSTIWKKYEKIKEINKNEKIKTYLGRIELIIKEIIIKDIKEFYKIRERLEKIKNIMKIYDIMEEKDKIYIVIENNEEMKKKIDELILSEEKNIIKEGKVKDNGNPVYKSEIMRLLKMEKSMCKIYSLNEKMEEIKGTGFFCEIKNYPIKYGLFTNNHI